MTDRHNLRDVPGIPHHDIWLDNGDVYTAPHDCVVDNVFVWLPITKLWQRGGGDIAMFKGDTMAGRLTITTRSA